MNRLALFAAACMMSAAAIAATPAEQRFDSMAEKAETLAKAKAYGEAAAMIETMASDPALTGLTDWPSQLYDQACYYALSGQADKALAAFEKAVALGAAVRVSAVEKDPDLASIRDTPRFQAALDVMKRRARLWADNPAMATPYKAVLSEEEKVAGLSKFWSEAKFNFPFFDRLPDLDWDAAYMDTLPKVRAAKTTAEYYDVMLRFAALLKDGHTRVLVPDALGDDFNGVTAVSTRLVEGKIIVTAVGDPALEAKGLHKGAEVVTIAGLPALKYAETRSAPYVFGFTPQDRAIWQYGYQLLRGKAGTPIQLTVRGGDGAVHSVAVPRFHNDGPFGILPKLDRTASFKMLPGNIAYLEINWFVDDAGLKMLKDNFAAASAADGLIIDIRENGGGNDDNSHDLVKVLADKPFMGSNWRTVDYKAAYRSWSRPVGWHRSPAPTFQPNPELHYAKPVVVLIGGRTYSAAEDFLISFISSGRGKLVGETSGGSTGNPMLFALPGGGKAFICTKDDSFADGRVLEGAGIKPDVTVAPTVADIRAGRDAAVEAAVAILKGKGK